MAGYTSKLKAEIGRWESAGMIDPATAVVLRRDVDGRPGGVSFGQILAMLAAVLIGAAILLVIAANWEAFPRLLRVFMIFALMAAGYVGGAILKGRGSHGFAEGAYVLGAVAFGAGIALIAQMYHVSGDETQAILVWCAGTIVAAVALRSEALTAGALLLAAAWMVMVTVEQRFPGLPPLSYLGLGAAIWAVSLWTRSVAARHLVLLSFMLFAIMHFVASEQLIAPLLLSIISVAVFAAWVLAPVESERVAQLGEGGLPVQALLGFIVGMSPVQFTYQDAGSFLLIVAIIFAAIVGALVLGGRDSRMLRWLGYAAFTYEVIYVYVVLVGSMIGTAGFFLSVGLVVAALAFAIGRVERRLRTPAGEAA